MIDNEILEEWCNNNQWSLDDKEYAKKTIAFQVYLLGFRLNEVIRYTINGFICELIGIYRTLRCMEFVSGHDFYGDKAYGELKCKRCGYTSKGDPRYDFSNAEKGKFYRPAVDRAEEEYCTRDGYGYVLTDLEILQHEAIEELKERLKDEKTNI